MILTRRHLIALCTAAAASQAAANNVPLVFAAASLKTVLDDISRDMPMRLNYAGSGILARQILQGAPADIFIAANPEWMRGVAQAGKLANSSVDLVSNRLVLIGSAPDPSFQMNDLRGGGRIAMGFTEAVPAGQYGKAALQSLALWADVAPQVVQTDNVRAALALVSRGEVAWGVVYKTDALADPSVHVLAEFAPEAHPPILYQAGVIKGSTASLDGLIGHRAFARHGFVAL